jgi:hypothetical protein
MHGVAGLGLFALFLTGCGGTARSGGNDPLVGGGPALPAETARAKEQPLPAVPAPSASTSPANLASGAVPALEGSRDLRIDGTESGRSRAPVTGASLTTPVPVGSGPGSLPPVPVVPMGGTPPAPASSLDLVRVLEQRGMQGFRLERNRETGQWRCTCSIPNAQNLAVKNTYDATAADAPAALQAIIDKIDREPR